MLDKLGNVELDTTHSHCFKRFSAMVQSATIPTIKQDGDRLTIKSPVSDSRPWGTFTVLDEGPGYKIKRIEVKPGHRLSLQMHHHRSEHWIVVSGTAKVTCNDREHVLSHNESNSIVRDSFILVCRNNVF